MIRRRDKRRHVCSNANANAIIDLRCPLSVIALAVRYDQASDDASLLEVPLELGRISSSKSCPLPRPCSIYRKRRRRLATFLEMALEKQEQLQRR